MTSTYNHEFLPIQGTPRIYGHREIIEDIDEPIYIWMKNKAPKILDHIKFLYHGFHSFTIHYCMYEQADHIKINVNLMKNI